MSQVEEKLFSLRNRHRKLEKKLKSLKDEVVISNVKVELIKLEGAMEALDEWKETMEPSFAEPDIKALLDMFHISRSLQNIRHKKEKIKEWKKKCKFITNKNITRILALAPLFQGREDGITSYHDIATSSFQHAQKFLHNSNEKIDGGDTSYSEFRELIKSIKDSSVFNLPSEKKDDALVPKVSLNIHRDIGGHTPPISVQTTPISIKYEMFVIDVLCTDGKVYKYSLGECFDNKFLSYKPFKYTLLEYLELNPVNKRRELLFDSKLLYPNRYVKGLIQGLLSAIVERIRDGEPHDFLMNMENILLHEPVYPPYPPSYYNSPKLKNCTEQILKDANEKRQFIVPVSFVHTTCTKKMDDHDAVYKIIFEEILEDTNYPLPQDWQLFKKAFEGSKRDTVYYEKLSSKSVLWDWQNQINLLMYAYHLVFYSSNQMKTMVQSALKNLDILNDDWGKIVMAEKPWDLVYTHNDAVFRNKSVDDLVKFFRNLVSHVIITTKTQAHLAYRISCLFPDLFAQIHEALYEIGIKY